MKTWRGSRKSSKVIKGDHLSEVTFKGGYQLNFTLFIPNPPPTPAMNNNRSLRCQNVPCKRVFNARYVFSLSLPRAD